jgi:hypothetical protein
MVSISEKPEDKELRGVQLHPVALVDDFNPKASKAGV